MIRSKPSTDEYREAWERVFGKFAADGAFREDDPKEALARPTRSHESDCPARIGDPCRCPVESQR